MRRARSRRFDLCRRAGRGALGRVPPSRPRPARRGGGVNVPLQDKIAVVTGGSGAIGSAIVAALEQQGARAVSLDVAQAPSGGLYQACDVGDDASVSSALAAVQRDYGRLDLVVHAAGISREGVLWKLAVEDWDAVQRVNLRGAFLLLRHAIPLMRAGGGGRIVLIGSINGSRGKFGTAAYSASKAGLIALAKTAAREVATFRHPCECRRTGMGAHSPDQDHAAGHSRRCPVGKPAGKLCRTRRRGRRGRLSMRTRCAADYRPDPSRGRWAILGSA